jgi:asparagine synthase (glutamine-hydrolysing)
MCGIAGFLNYASEHRVEVLNAMSEAIAHRGPDDNGVFLNDIVALAHTRLAVIDLSTGEQPMLSHDKRFITVFNGEIYNYRELKEELNRCVFQTQSDTEIIAEAIRAWGIEKAVLKFRGMFAFAVYDKKENKLYIARDRTGIKPFYYSEINGAFFFASEQKSLLEVPAITRKMNINGLHDVLTLGFPVSNDTCWKDINMFPPAHYSIVKPGEKIILRKYWEWNYTPQTMSFGNALEEAESVLQNSLKYHLRSDVPLAAFLSGGIDSSLLVSLISKGKLVDSLKTFNVGFDEKQYDESEDAEHVAKICGTEHHRLLMQSGAGNPDLFEKILTQYDEPYGDSSCLPTYLISREMRKQVKVVISGDGGDELFGGYDRFINVAKIASIGTLPGKPMIKFCLSLLRPIIGNERYRRFANALNMSKCSRSELFCMLHTYFKESEKMSLYNNDFAKKLTQSSATWARMEKFIPTASDNIGADLMNTELALNLHADYLRKVDIASSAHGLEVRVPFLDSAVIDFAARVPMDLKIKSGTLKYLLRELARKKISDRIADKGKWGFGLPFDKWCGAEMQSYLYDLLFSSDANNGIWTVFNKKQAELLWTNFKKPDSINRKNISRFQVYQRLFILASVQIWFKRFKPC